MDDAIRRQVSRVVDRMCPSWLRADRDDIIQNVLLRLHRLQTAGEGPDSLAASYVWKTVYTTTIDEIRRRNRRSEVTLDEAGSRPEVTAPRPSPETLSAGREIGEAIRGCLRVLPDQRRAAIVLHLQGHTVPEIATLLGWNLKKADNLVYRALASMRTCLDGKGVRP